MCLPSNVPGNAKNTPGQYETTLAKPHNLGPGWEVGLIDVTFPHSWMNINKKYFAVIALIATAGEDITMSSIILEPTTRGVLNAIQALAQRKSLPLGENERLKLKQFVTIPLKGEYDIKSLLEAIQKYIREVGNGLENTLISYDYDKNRIMVSGNTRTFYIFNAVENSLLQLLGFGEQTTNNRDVPDDTRIEWLKFESNNETQAMLACNLNPIKSIFCYSDITQFVMVGNTQAPLLGYFPVQTKLGDTGYWNFNPPYYVPVKDSGIRSIEMQLCSDTGETLKFKSGDVICRLNFRRTGSLRSIV